MTDKGTVRQREIKVGLKRFGKLRSSLEMFVQVGYINECVEDLK